MTNETNIVQAQMTSDNDALVIYTSEDGKVKLNVQFEGETVWLSQDQLAMLFDKAKSTISYHISNIFKDGELDENVVVRKNRITTQHGAANGRPVLETAGKVSSEQAKEKALAEYRKYQVRALTPVEHAYLAMLEKEVKAAKPRK